MHRRHPPDHYGILTADGQQPESVLTHYTQATEISLHVVAAASQSGHPEQDQEEEGDEMVKGGQEEPAREVTHDYAQFGLTTILPSQPLPPLGREIETHQL